MTLLNRISVSPLVKEAVTTRMHIPTAIPIPRRRFLRNCRTMLRTAMAATTRRLLTRETIDPTLPLMFFVPRLVPVDGVQRRDLPRDDKGIDDRENGDDAQAHDPQHQPGESQGGLEDL